MNKDEGKLLEEVRPWRGFLVLEDCGTHKVKRIWVHPGQTPEKPGLEPKS